MRKLIFVISISILSSCSSQWHLRKAIKKDPNILQTDTITHRDTIRTFTERVEVDSVFSVSSDTTIIIKDNLLIKHFIHNDSVYIRGECDSIFVEIPYEVEIPIDRWIEPDDNWLKDNWLIILIALAVAYILFKLK